MNITETPKILVEEKKKSEAWDWNDALEHIKSLDQRAMSYLGKDGMNPFSYREFIILPLLKLNKSEENYRKILSVKFEEPLAEKFLRHPITGITREEEKKATFAIQ